MAFGLKIWDELGNVVLDTNVRVGRIIGQVTSGTSAGSISVPDFAQGTPWFIVQPITSAGFTAEVPNVTISGNTLSWTFPLAPNYTSISSIISYGVF